MRVSETSVIKIVGSADTLSAVRHWLDDGQTVLRRRGRGNVTLRVEPIISAPAQTAGGADNRAPAASVQETASLIDA